MSGASGADLQGGGDRRGGLAPTSFCLSARKVSGLDSRGFSKVVPARASPNIWHIPKHLQSHLEKFDLLAWVRCKYSIDSPYQGHVKFAGIGTFLKKLLIQMKETHLGIKNLLVKPGKG